MCKVALLLDLDYTDEFSTNNDISRLGVWGGRFCLCFLALIIQVQGRAKGVCSPGGSLSGKGSESGCWETTWDSPALQLMGFLTQRMGFLRAVARIASCAQVISRCNKY